MMTSRRAIRRAGADLTQAMLYAAFAIFVLVSVLYGYTMVDLRRSKASTTTLMTFISSEIRGLYAGQANVGSLDSEHLINAGSVPLGQAREVAGEFSIIAPHGGFITFSPTADPLDFRATIEWPAGGRTPRALCLHLVGTDEEEEGAGPLGTDYVIEDSDCYGESPMLIAIYGR